MFNFLKRIFGKKNQPEKSAKIVSEDIIMEEGLEDTSEEEMLRIYQPEPIDDTEFIWCLVGNIIGEHPYGEKKEIKRGTKHFTPKTKVYCFPARWGDGYEKIKVIGRNRNNKRFITVIIPSKYITNWRIQKVYNPYIVKQMISQNGWTDCETDKDIITKMLKWLPERTMKNKPE